MLAYVLTKSVELLERGRRYQEATEVLQELLAQDVYLPQYRGKWYERLALDLDQHLKRPGDSLKSIWTALDDPRVHPPKKMLLCQRVEKVCSSKKHEKALGSELARFSKRPDWTTPATYVNVKVTIQGQQVDKDSSTGMKSLFVYSDASGGGTVGVGSVEEYSLEWFRANEGFTDGLHSEGTSVGTLYTLLFWSAIYDVRVEDAFRTPFQRCPLDHGSDCFYDNRRTAVDKRLDEIEAYSDDELRDYLKERWESACELESLVNWKCFASWEQVAGLALCFERKQLRAICERLVKNFRHTRSGFPDLTLWNAEEGRVKVKREYQYEINNVRIYNAFVCRLLKLRVLAIDCQRSRSSG